MKDSQKKKKKRLFKKTTTKPAVIASVAKQSTEGKQRKLRLPRPLHGLAMTNIERHEPILVLTLIPLILIVVFAIIYVLNSRLVANIQNIKLASSLSSEIASYPVTNYPISPLLSAKAAIALEGDTQTIIFSKNSDLRFSMASTAKIMTALVALDYYQPDSILTIKSAGPGGSMVGLTRGDKFYFEDLLYAMMLPSANDAAVAIVDNYPGGKIAFISKMNEKARAWHLTDTLFSDPTGLDDDGNFTTVVDLARLGSMAIRNERLARVISTQQKTVSNLSGSRKYVLSNLNKLLGFNGVNGVKTGTTEGAGEVLVTSAVIADHTFIIVVMNSEDRFGDTTVLLNNLSNNVRFVDPATPKNNF